MTFQCNLCPKSLPSRSGIWNHLKTKHFEIFIQTTDEFGKRKRQKLDQYFTCEVCVKPIKSFSGRPVDDTVIITKKINEKSKILNEDLSLRTLSNIQMNRILQEISKLPTDQLQKYLRNPSNQAYEQIQYLNIFEDDCIQTKKFKNFLNRLLDFFTKEFNEKLMSYANTPLDQIVEEDQFLKTVLKNASEYSN